MVRIANVTIWSAILLILLSAFFTGCNEKKWIELPQPPVAIPAANVPLELRQKNWPDARGSGSCVIASTCSTDAVANLRASMANELKIIAAIPGFQCSLPLQTT